MGTVGFVAAVGFLSLILPIAAIVALIVAWKKRQNTGAFPRWATGLAAYVFALLALAGFGARHAFAWPRITPGGEFALVGAAYTAYVFTFMAWIVILGPLNSTIIYPKKSVLRKAIAVLMFLIFAVFHVYLTPYFAGVFFEPCFSYLVQSQQVTDFLARTGAGVATMSLLGLNMLVTGMIASFGPAYLETLRGV